MCVCVCARGESGKRKKILARLSKEVRAKERREERSARKCLCKFFILHTHTLALEPGLCEVRKGRIKLLNLCDSVSVSSFVACLITAGLESVKRRNSSEKWCE